MLSKYASKAPNSLMTHVPHYQLVKGSQSLAYTQALSTLCPLSMESGNKIGHYKTGVGPFVIYIRVMPSPPMRAE